MKRRDFIQTSLAAGSAAFVLPSRGWGAPSLNETMNVGLIGSGRMGCANMLGILGNGMKEEINARIVSVCDPDSNRMANARKLAEKFYQEQGESEVGIKQYEDFRDMLADPSIDAVVIATPDRWHALQGIAAANAGKHIYMQKPLTYSIPEGKALVEAVRRNKVTLQVGSQQRSSVYFRRVCNIVRNNWLGELKEIVVEIPTDGGRADYVEMAVPQNLNYDLWQGPAAEKPYTEMGVHSQTIRDGMYFGRPGWLQREDFCLGMITGWGAHMYDIAQWGMGTDLDGGPVEIRAKGEFPDRGIFNVHVGYEGEALYENGVILRSRNGSAGVAFIMEDGEARCWRGGMTCSDPELLRRQPSAGEVSLYGSKGGHERDFLTAARAGRDGVCSVEAGHRTNTICVLHHISMKLDGRTLKWDPKTEQIIGDAEASSLIDAPMRAPWTI